MADTHFTVTDLRRFILEFIEYKRTEGVPFAQLVLLHYRMFGGQMQDIYQAAAAVELMILSLDIFDDLQDQDHHAMPWNQINPAVAMNIATGLMLLSSKVLGESSFDPNAKLLAIDCLQKQVVTAVNGQHMDLSNPITSENEFILMVKQKSGSLLAMACLIGTLLVTEDYHEVVKTYSEHMGIAIQIKNDIRDIFRWDEKNDLMHKKVTLPVLYLLKNQQPQFQMIRDYYDGKVKREDLFSNHNRLKEWITASGALEYANVIMRTHQLQALKGIESLPVDQSWKEKLLHYL